MEDAFRLSGDGKSVTIKTMLLEAMPRNIVNFIDPPLSTWTRLFHLPPLPAVFGEKQYHKQEQAASAFVTSLVQELKSRCVRYGILLEIETGKKGEKRLVDESDSLTLVGSCYGKRARQRPSHLDE